MRAPGSLNTWESWWSWSSPLPWYLQAQSKAVLGLGS